MDEDDEKEVDSNELYRDFCYKAMELCVHFGLLNAVVHQYPPHVREGLIERMKEMMSRMEQEIEIVQGFGEAFDERPE